jgi:hypothetical protein
VAVQHRQNEVVHGWHCLGGRATPNTTAVLAEGDTAVLAEGDVAQECNRFSMAQCASNV